VVQRSSRILAPAVARPQTAAESRILAPAFNWRSRPSTSLPEACCSLCVMIKQQFPSFQFYFTCTCMGSCYRASALRSTQHLCQVTHPSDSRKRPLSPRWGGFVCALVFNVVLFFYLCFSFFWFFNICFICTCPLLFSSGSDCARCCLCFLLLCDVSCFCIAFALLVIFSLLFF
jgi:hypothetical protein